MKPDVPAFMLNDVPSKFPKLDPSEITVGSSVVLIRPSNLYRHGSNYVSVPAKVVHKARVWIEVAEFGCSTTHRLRLDDQTDGTGSHRAYRFRTPVQHRYIEAATEANTYLWGQGITVNRGTRWDHEERLIRLARMIWSDQNTTD